MRILEAVAAVNDDRERDGSKGLSRGAGEIVAQLLGPTFANTEDVHASSVVLITDVARHERSVRAFGGILSEIALGSDD